MADLSALCTKYFEVWNAHDGQAVGKLFAAEGTLRDWDIEVSGAEAVGQANGKIFEAVPNIKIEVLKIHVSPSTSSASCEILVHVNNDAKEVIKVVDVIEFNAEGMITAIRAYKG